MVPIDDPVYQLNLVLHFLMKGPRDAPIVPFLHRLRFELDSVERSLPLPPAVRTEAAAGAEVTSQPRPDVLARREGNTYLLIECKASSFGPESGSATQARGLILAAADLREPLAMAASSPAPYGCVAYMLPNDDAAQMQQTLIMVRQLLQDLRLAVSSVCTLGLEIREDGLYVICHGNRELPSDAAQFLIRPLRVQRAPLSRPFYLLPWLPSVLQRREEQQYCLRCFSAAIWQAAVSTVGQARPQNWPADLVLSVDEILMKATHGVWEHWRNRDDVTNIRRLVRSLLSRALRQAKNLPPYQWAGNGSCVTFRLSSVDELIAVRTCLDNASPAENVAEVEDSRQLEFPFA